MAGTQRFEVGCGTVAGVSWIAFAADDSLVGWVERSDTPSMPAQKMMGFASLYPSYDRRTFAISRRISPEVCIFVCPLRNQRAQGRPGACCTRGLACDLR